MKFTTRSLPPSVGTQRFHQICREAKKAATPGFLKDGRVWIVDEEAWFAFRNAVAQLSKQEGGAL